MTLDALLEIDAAHSRAALDFEAASPDEMHRHRGQLLAEVRALRIQVAALAAVRDAAIGALTRPS